MNLLDRSIAIISPVWAAERARARLQFEAYDAAITTGRTRKTKRERRSGDAAVRNAGRSLREQAVWLDENYDLVAGILDTFCVNVVGPNGIAIEPMPKKSNGELHTELAGALSEQLANWSRNPEVRGELDRAAMEKIACLTWARQGECFAQHIEGRNSRLDHLTDVPYSLELIEPELVPMDYDDPRHNVVQGIGANAWGRPNLYWVYKGHPGDVGYPMATELKTIPASRMSHLKSVRRIGQRRGVTKLATVIQRLEDIKDYEESERIAARISAALAAYIRKGTPDLYEADPSQAGDDGSRMFEIAPGIIWDDLQVGEDVGTIQSNRPSNLLQPFRDSMLKAVAAGTQTGYSSIAKDYSGTFSAQRQELVEQFVHYSSNTANFISQFTRPYYQRFVRTAIASGVVTIPDNVNVSSIDDADYRGPVMPWIDPVKEASAAVTMVQAGFKSRSQVIRERGGNPSDVYEQIKRERAIDYQDGLIFSSDEASQDKSVTDKIIKGDPEFVDVDERQDSSTENDTERRK